MIAIGEWSLWIAVLMAAVTTAASFAGGAMQRSAFVKGGERALYVTCGFTVLAALGLWTALFRRDFGITFVAENSSLYLSTIYTFTAFWAGHAGSLLLWTLILTLWSAVAVRSGRRTHHALMPWVTGTLGVVSLFFLVTVAFGANPFERLEWIPPDGRGMNPQLQHPGMALHPPLLYLGLAGTTVPFAFAIGGLMARRFDASWLVTVRRWASMSWFFLTIGIVLGMWWAYATPGWGGYWAWDAVQNASLLPWLTGTAFLHSLVVQEQRGMLRRWNVTLVVLTFLLSVLGVWITRSGAVDSVHAFARSPVGGWFFGFLAGATLLTAFLMRARFGDQHATEQLESMVSREGAMLSNNAVLVAMCVATMWGTLFPVVSAATTGERAIFGPPFFNAVNGALGVVLLALMGVGPLLAWHRAPTGTPRRQFTWPAIPGIIVLVVLLALGVRQWFALVVYPLAGFALGAIMQEFVTGVAARRRTLAEPVGVAAWRLIGHDRRRHGGYVVHMGVVALFCAFGGLAFRTDVSAILSTGESVEATDPYGRQWKFASQGISSFDQPDRSVVAVSLSATRDGKPMGLLISEQRQQVDGRGEPTFEPSTTAGILASPSQDVYLMFIQRLDKDSAAIRIQFNPLVWWVWFGGILMALGGLIVMWPKAQRTHVVLRNEDATPVPERVAVSDDEVEAAIQRARAMQQTCDQCGPRPEPDALYCSTCGRALGNE